VVADVIDLAQRLRAGMVARRTVPLDESRTVVPMEETESRFYIRLEVDNRPGVFAQITTVLGEAGISLASVIQKEERDAGRMAEVVLTTYRALEASMSEAVRALSALPAVAEVSNVIRIEE
jgi:homoserine dehydrogenase